MSESRNLFAWFERRSIEGKFRLIFGLLGGLAAFAALVVLIGVMRIGQSHEDYASMADAASAVSEARAHMSSAEFSFERAERTRSAGAIDQAREDLEKAREAINRSVESIGAERDETAARADELVSALASFDRSLSTLAQVLEDGTARGAALDTAYQEQIAVEERLDTLLRRYIADAASYRDEAAGHTKVLVAALAGLALAAGALILGGFSVMRNGIVKPVTRITAATRKLIAGESDVTIPCTSRAHEIGELARAVKVFKDHMIEMERLQAEAARDAQAKLHQQEEREHAREEAEKLRDALIKQMVDDFERTVGEVVHGVAAASSELQATASSMAASAQQSAQQAGSVTNALTEASSGVTAAAAASDEFAMSIGEISRQASTSADLARRAATNAAQANDTVTALSSAAGQIGEIVELISTIAKRTNLLALNASIEAARGGEAGRGFAVVAAEVKDLAAQTGKATDEVAAKIRMIQDSTEASVEALRTIGDHVGELESTSISIAAAVDQQSVAGQDLARSIDLAARNTDDVSSNIVQVREGTLATGAAASQVLTSSSELQTQASALRAKAGEFLSRIRAA